MNYIIEPRLIYLIGIVNNLRTLFITLLVVLVAGLIATCIVFIASAAAGEGYGEDDRDNIRAKAVKKPMFILAICSLIAAAIVVFIPSKEVVIEMAVAKCATFENAEWTVESIKSLIDYIVETINSVK